MLNVTIICIARVNRSTSNKLSTEKTPLLSLERNKFIINYQTVNIRPIRMSIKSQKSKQYDVRVHWFTNVLSFHVEMQDISLDIKVHIILVEVRLFELVVHCNKEKQLATPWNPRRLPSWWTSCTHFCQQLNPFVVQNPNT